MILIVINETCFPVNNKGCFSILIEGSALICHQLITKDYTELLQSLDINEGLGLIRAGTPYCAEVEREREVNGD